MTQVASLQEGHVNWLKTYFAAGIFVAAGRKIPRTGGVILTSSVQRDELERILAEDPFTAVADFPPPAGKVRLKNRGQGKSDSTCQPHFCGLWSGKRRRAVLALNKRLELRLHSVCDIRRAFYSADRPWTSGLSSWATHKVHLPSGFPPPMPRIRRNGQKNTFCLLLR